MWLRANCTGLMCVVLAAPVVAEDSVAKQVDGLVAHAAGQAVGPVIDDAAFCRRVHLDFTGRIPTVDELQAFVADTAANKRATLIDRLLAGPEFPPRMRDVFHVQWMERLGENEEWTKFLEASFAANKPWDQMVRELLSPVPDDESRRGAAFFLTKRLEHYGEQPVDYPGLTRDIGRLFLGVDLQCAQCHDHLFVDDYKQLDFQGLHTVVLQTFIRQDVKFPAVGEKPLDRKTEFMSVFVKEPQQTGPRLPFGTEVEIPVFARGEEFETPPDKKTKFPGTPKFSPLKALAERLPTKDNPWFVRNTVNRAWCQLMGRGLVHPLDLQHAKNPPSHPEVMDLLAREFVAHQFDMQWLLRELALTETYQRSSILPQGSIAEPPLDRYIVALEKPLSAEQLATSAWLATGHALPLPDDVRKKFLSAYANPPREPEGEFAPSVKAALFLSHDATVLGWLTPGKGNLAERAAAEADNGKSLELIYRTVLSRSPRDEELAELTKHLSATDRAKAIGDAIWALLTSTEFCVNH
jgi:hypothetical protein